jgi:hypothetical protein
MFRISLALVSETMVIGTEIFLHLARVGAILIPSLLQEFLLAVAMSAGLARPNFGASHKRSFLSRDDPRIFRQKSAKNRH